MSLSHQNIQDYIQSRHQLTSQEQAALDEHLAGCPECRAYAAIHQTLLATLPYPKAAPRLSEREIHEKIRAVNARIEQRRWPARIFQNTLSQAGAAAALILVVVFFIIVPRMMPGHPAATAEAPLAAAGVSDTTRNPTTAFTPQLSAEPTLPWLPAFPIEPGTTSSAEPVQTPSAASTPTSVLNRVVAAVAVQDQTAYIGIDSRLVAIDLRQPAAPQLLAQSEDLPGEVLKVLSIPADPSPRIAAAAGRYLAVFDPSVPGELGLITQSKLPGTISALIIEIGPNRIYAGGSLHGDAAKGFIAVLDASQPDTLHLLDTIEMRAPVQSLARSNGVVYAALAGDAPGVMALPIPGERFGTPVEAIANLSVSSMTAVQGVLYMGSGGQILAYDLDDPNLPRFARRIESAGGTPLPGSILGFELRANLIYTAGLDASGQPFRLAVPLTSPIQTGSVVDTASHLAAANGMMLVAGDRLEIYDILDPLKLKLLGTYPAVQP